MKYLILLIFPGILFAGDPVLPPSEVPTNFSQSDVGRTIIALQDKPARGLYIGQTYTITLVQNDLYHAMTTGGGVGIHIVHLGEQWQFTNTLSDQISPRSYSEEFFILNELPNNFPSQGEKPTFGIVHSITSTAQWNTTGSTAYEQKRNGYCTFVINDPQFIEHNIPNHAFNIGNDTYKLSSFNRYGTLESEEISQGTSLVPYLQLQQFYLQPVSPNRSYILTGFTNDFRTTTITRNIWLQYQIVFTRQKWNGTFDEVYLKHDQPITLFTRYEN